MTPKEERDLQRLRDSLDRPARDGLLSSFPKGTIAKVVFLLILLGGVIYLKTRTGLLLKLLEPSAKPATSPTVPSVLGTTPSVSPVTGGNPVPSSPR